MLHENADKRYLDFNERYPSLRKESLNTRLPHLGISHEFLSKVIKE
jgi:hypothetical protein